MQINCERVPNSIQEESEISIRGGSDQLAMIPISPLRIDSVRFAPAAKENAIDATHSASQQHLHLEFGIRWLPPEILTDDLEKAIDRTRLLRNQR